MKIPVVVSVLILAIAAVFGWQLDQRLAQAGKTEGELAREAGQLGISIDPSHPDEPAHITKHPREEGDSPALLATGFLALAKEMETLRKSGAKPSDAMQEKLDDFWLRMRSLGNSQQKSLITSLQSSDSSKESFCQSTIHSLLSDMAIDCPHAVLAIFSETPDLLTTPEFREILITNSLSAWSKENPMAALDWLRGNGGRFPEINTEKSKCVVIYGAAARDPRLAFKLIGELGLRDTGGLAGGILKAAETAEDRTTALAAFRQYLATLGDEKSRKAAETYAVTGMTSGIVKDGFATATRWLAGVDLTPDELRRFANRLPGLVKDRERGQWIDWVGKTLPADKAGECVWSHVTEWTKKDYQAAGNWIAASADGPVKNSAIRAYAVTVSGFEP